GVTAISLGSYHTCALAADGVKCWGYGNSGALGDGLRKHRAAPVDAVGLAGDIAGLSAGNGHTCVVTEEGGVKCWGSNDYGGLGDGTSKYDPYPRPVFVQGLASDVSAVGAGAVHTCAIISTGGVKCWGDNFAGQLGDGTDTDR